MAGPDFHVTWRALQGELSNWTYRASWIHKGGSENHRFEAFSMPFHTSYGG